MVNWAYADWDSQSTDALCLARLKLHIQEVSGFMLETMSKGRSIRINQDYMRILKEFRDELQKNVALQTIGSRAGRTSSFVRGSGP